MAVAAALGASRAEIVRMAIREIVVLAPREVGWAFFWHPAWSQQCNATCRQHWIFAVLYMLIGSERGAR